MDSKKCPKCGHTKLLTEFNKNKSKSDGRQIYCRECDKARSKDSYDNGNRKQQIRARDRRNKEANHELVKRYKRFCGCTKCDEREVAVMDLHHLDPSIKEANPSEMYKHSRAKLKAEIRKCVVLCANCHRKVHAGII